ncbi:hypothetical protein BJ986_000737 [Phycicoccus badiiscoriae]|uniref:Uncharacterized protein n=1 Tax=Pedococcus badiiscoriae TaxID=642776 RepID=A0A852WC49_9MICO|nr:hypothetical protein [Pedococcus badiiscoriae]NYG06250.1 hypothetical protein [Pedococcus badiiscoriae]
MTVSPLPRHGDVIVGRDVAGRTLRISGHPDSGRVVLSIWQDTVCRATLRLSPDDVPQFVEMLTRCAIARSDTAGPATSEDAGRGLRDLGTAG